MAGHREKSRKILETQYVDNIVGNCFLIKRAVIEKIGLLDEGLSPFYGEETDYCLRSQKAGFRNLYVGRALVAHYREGSICELDADEVWYIKLRNSIRLELLNYSFLKILRYNLSHLVSPLFTIKNYRLVLQKNRIKKIFLLLKAYLHNLKNIGEIFEKRHERSYLK